MEKWSPRAKLRIDLSAIKNAIVSEVEESEERERFLRGIRERFKTERENDQGFSKDWEPIKAFKLRLREFEHKNSSSELFGGFRKSEIVEKIKNNLV